MSRGFLVALGVLFVLMIGVVCLEARYRAANVRPFHTPEALADPAPAPPAAMTAPAAVPVRSTSTARGVM